MLNGLLNARGKYIHYINSGDIVSNPVDLHKLYKNIQEKISKFRCVALDYFGGNKKILP